MPSRDIKDLDMELAIVWRQSLVEYVMRYPNKPVPFLTCTHRTEKEQAELYAQGRTKPGPVVTWLKKGSRHNEYPAKAFDIAFKTTNNQLDWNSELFANFAAIVRELNPAVEWGGDWKKKKDLPHFQIND